MRQLFSEQLGGMKSFDGTAGNHKNIRAFAESFDLFSLLQISTLCLSRDIFCHPFITICTYTGSFRGGDQKHLQI